MTDVLRELRHLIGVHRPSEADLEVVAVVVFYVLAVIWLARLWLTRHQARQRRQLDRGLAFMDGVVALLRVVVLLALGVLLALVRAAGRPAVLPLVELRSASMDPNVGLGDLHNGRAITREADSD